MIKLMLLAERTVPRCGRLGSEDDALDLPRRDLGQELLAEHAIQAPDV